jgi:hypothetical protein
VQADHQRSPSITNKSDRNSLISCFINSLPGWKHTKNLVIVPRTRRAVRIAGYAAAVKAQLGKEIPKGSSLAIKNGPSAFAYSWRTISLAGQFLTGLSVV